MKKTFGQRQIPTLVGLAVLVLSLIAGIAFIGTGGGVFAPRAAPQTTPKNVKMTNVKDTGFTVSFITDEATTAFIKYGTEPNSLKSQASDDRDQLAGNVSQYTTHYITVRDLQPDTTYYYTLGTASTPKFDNNGQPFTLKTAKRSGNPPNAKTIYGNVNTSAGSAAGGAIVYVSLEGAGELSSLTKDSGSWAIPLSSARTTDGSQYAVIDQGALMRISVQGTHATEVATLDVVVSEAQPAPTITLGEGAALTGKTNPGIANEASETGVEKSAQETSNAVTSNENSTSTTASPSSDLTTQNPIDTTGTRGTTEPVAKIVDLKDETPQVVETTQPVITGQAAPNTKLTIEIHSDTQITTTTTTDSNGNFTVDLESLKKQLEPGEHTITISYVDPNTGKTVTETKTFTVTAAESGTGGGDTLLAAASPKPFGTGNPFTITSPSPTPSPTASASTKPRVSVAASTSAIPRSGSTTTTFMLLFGGAFFFIAGMWSYTQNFRMNRVKST